MDLETYLRIVHAVRHRPDSPKLTFQVSSFGFNYGHLLPDFSRNAHLVEMIVK